MPQIRISLVMVIDVPQRVFDTPGARAIVGAPVPISIYKPDAHYGECLWTAKGVPRVVGIEKGE